MRLRVTGTLVTDAGLSKPSAVNPSHPQLLLIYCGYPTDHDFETDPPRGVVNNRYCMLGISCDLNDPHREISAHNHSTPYMIPPPTPKPLKSFPGQKREIQKAKTENLCVGSGVVPKCGAVRAGRSAGPGGGGGGRWRAALRAVWPAASRVGLGAPPCVGAGHPSTWSE